MSPILQGYGAQGGAGPGARALLLGGYGSSSGLGGAQPDRSSATGALSWGWWWQATTPPADVLARTSALAWGAFWQSTGAWLPWPARFAPAPALWWSWWWAAPLAAPAHTFSSARRLGGGRYRYQSRGGGPMGAQPSGATPHTVSLRSRDRFVPFVLSFAQDVSGTDEVIASTITVTAHPAASPAATPSDVTAQMLLGQSQSGTSVTAILANANAVPGTAYRLEVVVVMASGLALAETIGDGNPTRVICDG